MPLGTKVGLCPGNIVFDADPAPPPKGHRPAEPQFSAHVCYGQTVAHLSYCSALVKYLAPFQLTAANSRVYYGTWHYCEGNI